MLYKSENIITHYIVLIDTWWNVNVPKRSTSLLLSRF